MNPRRSPLITTAVVAAAIGLAGCTPAPVPEPTPTPLFASEAEAFKAAEQVFGQFVRAKNQAQNGDRNANSQQFLVGSALEDDIRAEREQGKSGIHIEGTSTVVSFSLKKFDTELRSVESVACIDVSKSRVVDANGEDSTPTNRQPIVAVTIKTMPLRTEMRIFEISGSADSCG